MRMETRDHGIDFLQRVRGVPSFEGWNPQWVPSPRRRRNVESLPMRDGNDVQPSQQAFSGTVESLPMRDGNPETPGSFFRRYVF